MRSRTFPIALASLLLVIFFAPSANAQSNELRALIAQNDYIPWQPTKNELNRLTQVQFDRRWNAELVRVGTYKELHKALCSDAPNEGSQRDILALAEACSDLSLSISLGDLHLYKAKKDYERDRVQDDGELAEMRWDVVIGEEVAVIPHVSDITGDTLNEDGTKRTHVLKLPGALGVFPAEFDLYKSVLGDRDTFIRSCTGNPDHWSGTYEEALELNRGATQLPAYAPSFIEKARVPTDNADLRHALETVIGQLEQVSKRTREANDSPAQRARLDLYLATNDFSPNTCGELYDFAMDADRWNLDMTIAFADVVIVSTAIVAQSEGDQARIRHMNTLSTLSGGWIFRENRLN